MYDIFNNLYSKVKVTKKTPETILDFGCVYIYKNYSSFPDESASVPCS